MVLQKRLPTVEQTIIPDFLVSVYLNGILDEFSKTETVAQSSKSQRVDLL